MISITKRQLLGWVLTMLLSAGGYLAATEPVPEPTEVEVAPLVIDLADIDATNRATAAAAHRYDDGVSVPGGAHLTPVHDRCRPRPFWQRGPIRRTVSAPVRWFFHRRLRWR